MAGTQWDAPAAEQWILDLSFDSRMVQIWMGLTGTSVLQSEIKELQLFRGKLLADPQPGENSPCHQRVT